MKKLLDRINFAKITLAVFALFSLILITLPQVNAATLTSISDELDDSRPAVDAKHTIGYTSSTAVTAGQTIKISFPDGFTVPTSFAVGDFAGTTGMTVVAACDGATDEVTFTSSNTGGDKHVTFTVCTGDTVGAGAKTIVIGASTTKITNPTKVAAAGTADIYTITIAGTQTDSGTTRVAIQDGQSVSLTVDAAMSFTIAGKADTTTCTQGGDTIDPTVTTTATTIPFGTVTTSTNAIGIQDLTVSTNAGNGYTIYTQYTAPPTSGANDIDDHSGTNAAPSNFSAAGTEAFGYATNDATLGTGTPGRFTDGAGTEWAAFTTTNSEIAFDSAPVSSQTTCVGYQVGIASTTPSGTYTTTVIHTATPLY